MPDIFTALVATASAALGAWVNARFTNHSAKASFEATNAILKKEIAQLEAKNSASQSKILELQAHIEKHLTIRAIRERFTVDPATADMMIGDIHYCTPCFNDGSDPPKEIQMKPVGNQFICPKCDKPRRIVATPNRPRSGNI